jgi:hypothetical protein
MILAADMTIFHFILTLIISFVAFVIIALYLNHSRRRLRKTKHGLTGMCHQNGGAMCTSCQDQINKNKPDS